MLYLFTNDLILVDEILSCVNAKMETSKQKLESCGLKISCIGLSSLGVRNSQISIHITLPSIKCFKLN